MDKIKFESIKIAKMASGHFYLEFVETIDWHDFPNYASTVLKKLNGKVLKKAESFEIHLLDVVIDVVKLQFVWDDYPYMISLESDSDARDELLKTLFEKLSSACP